MFDDALLDDEDALSAADPQLRELAGAGARVRVDAHAVGEVLPSLVARAESDGRPRAVVAAGAAGRLLRAVLEPSCPVPLVAWPGAGLPGWAGGLDLVVLAAPDGPEARAAALESVRRGCPLLLAAAAGSALAEAAASRWTTLLPTSTADPLATAVVCLQALAALGLAPEVDAEEVSRALDGVAVEASPFADLGSNPAKLLASSLGDAQPLLWGGSVLAARAARRWAEALRRATGRAVLAAEADDLVALMDGATPHDVFADPYEDGPVAPASCLVVLDDGAQTATVREARGRLLAAAERQGVRYEVVTADEGGDVARYARLIALGSYAAAYLQIGLGR